MSAPVQPCSAPGVQRCRDAPDAGENAADDEQFEGDQRRWRLLPGLLPFAPLLPPADLVVVDVETTGWLADAASITEIGAVRLSAGRAVEEYSALVNPGAPIPEAIMSLTGITDAMVSDAPSIGAVLPGFLAFAAGGILVAHNAPFDVAFLMQACQRSGIEWPGRPVIDTAVLSRMLLGPGEVEDHKLATLSTHFDAGTGPCHRALADARATAAVLGGLLRLLAAGPRLPAGPPRYVPPAVPARADTAVPAPADTAASTPADGQGTGAAGGSADAGRAVLNGSAPSRYDVAPAGAAAERAQGVREAAMVTAIVLIKADVARIPETAEAIAQIPQVSEVYSVTGEFDLVAMVRVRDHEELADVIPGTVNKVAGVTHTETHIAFRAYSRHDLDAAFSIGYPEPA